jgi:hypothetical protein
LTSAQASTGIETWESSIKDAINDGLDLGQAGQAQCGAALLEAAGDACEEVLAAESAHIADLAADPDASTLDAAKMAASSAFLSDWADATSGTCPTNATDQGIASEIESLTDQVVLDTTVAPGLDDQAFTALMPGPPTPTTWRRWAIDSSSGGRGGGDDGTARSARPPASPLVRMSERELVRVSMPVASAEDVTMATMLLPLARSNRPRHRNDAPRRGGVPRRRVHRDETGRHGGRRACRRADRVRSLAA